MFFLVLSSLLGSKPSGFDRVLRIMRCPSSKPLVLQSRGDLPAIIFFLSTEYRVFWTTRSTTAGGNQKEATSSTDGLPLVFRTEKRRSLGRQGMTMVQPTESWK